MEKIKNSYFKNGGGAKDLKKFLFFPSLETGTVITDFDC
jgi:hypothetical protein